ncbi:MFS family permease [Kineococcus radiotolerans]|uniref:MFS family permease n=1 Tax=Kineococcus radiotolerans TaxID=131568 RepID=A0A7W4TI85_KINRA|nr:MFS transporter [Kineococcus radiotolerans]MBB2899360.1 MFS family permease [Kineococcus radiotolerans]
MNPRTRLWSVLVAHTTSTAGNAATAIALPLFVLDTTGSTTLTGVVGAAAVAPVVVGGVFGGVLVDRFGYRRTSVVSDAVGAVTIATVPLLHATTGLPFWALLALVVATGLLDTPGQAARHALLPELAAEAGVPLERATGWMDAAERAARLVGAPAAGALVSLLGAPLVLAVDALTFVLAAVLIAVAVPAGWPATGPADGTAGGEVAAQVGTAPLGGARGYLRELRVGLTFVRGDRLLLAVIAMVAVTNAFDAAYSSVVLPVYATERLDGGVDLGLLVGAFGAGAVAGAFAFGAVGGRWSRRRIFTVAFLLAGGPRFALLALDPGLPVLLAGVVLSGVAAGALNPILSAVELERVPPGARARVAGVVGAGAWAAMPVGILGAGLWLESGSLTTLLLVLAVSYLLITLTPALFPVWRELDRRPQAPPTRP